MTPLYIIRNGEDVDLVVALVTQVPMTVFVSLAGTADAQTRERIQGLSNGDSLIKMYDPTTQSNTCCKECRKSNDLWLAVIKYGSYVLGVTILGYFWFKGGSKVPNEVKLPSIPAFPAIPPMPPINVENLYL